MVFRRRSRRNEGRGAPAKFAVALGSVAPRFLWGCVIVTLKCARRLRVVFTPRTPLGVANVCTTRRSPSARSGGYRDLGFQRCRHSHGAGSAMTAPNHLAPTLRLQRDVFAPGATLSRVWWQGLPFGFACEDSDRGLDWKMDPGRIASIKVKGQTAIPTGTYRIALLWSDKHEQIVPWILDVPGFQAIEIHVGNTPTDTDGCVLPGTRRDTEAGKVTHSTPACRWLYTEIAKLISAGQPVTLQIERDEPAWRRFKAHQEEAS